MPDDSPTLPARRQRGKSTLSPAKKAEIAQRRAKIASLFAKGVKCPRELAQLVHCSRMTVAADLKWLRRKWQEEAKLTYNEITSQLLHELDVRKREAWAFYLRSQQPAETTRTIEGEAHANAAPGKRTIHESKGQAGDARFFSILRDITRQEKEIHGIPKRLADEGDPHAGVRLTLAMIPADLLQQMNAHIDAAQQIEHHEIEARFADGKEPNEEAEAVARSPIESPTDRGGKDDSPTGKGQGDDGSETSDGDREAEAGGGGTSKGDGEP